MAISEIVTAVLFANGLTLTMIYAVFRLRKDERDLKEIGLFLFCCLIAGIMAWPVAQPEAQRSDLSLSAVQAADPQ